MDRLAPGWWTCSDVRRTCSKSSAIASSGKPGSWSEEGVRLAQTIQVGPHLWEYSYKRLKLAQLLGQLCIFLFLTWPPRKSPQRLGACARSAGSIDQYHTCGQGHPCLNTLKICHIKSVNRRGQLERERGADAGATQLRRGAI